MEAVRVPAHSVSPGFLQAKQLCHLHAQLSLGQSCHRQKKSCIYTCRVASVVSNFLHPHRRGHTELDTTDGTKQQQQQQTVVCQSSDKNTEAYWPILVTIPFSVQFSSVAQSCMTLCNPMNRSTPGLPVHHQLPESTQTHVH